MMKAKGRIWLSKPWPPINN